MRGIRVQREIRLFLMVLALVVGPTAALSILAARVLRNWQLVAEQQLETAAAARLEVLSPRLRQGLEELGRACASAAAEARRPEALWFAAAALRARHPELHQLLVASDPGGLLYPSVLPVPQFDHFTSPDVPQELEDSEQFRRAEKTQHVARNWTDAAAEFERWLERPGLSAAARCEVTLRLYQCHRKAGRPERATAALRMTLEEARRGAPSGANQAAGGIRNPHGYRYDLMAQRLLCDLLAETGPPAAALEQEIELAETALREALTTDPLQRDMLLDQAAARLPERLAAARREMDEPDYQAAERRAASWEQARQEMARGIALSAPEREAIATAWSERRATVTTNETTIWCEPNGDVMGLTRLSETSNVMAGFLVQPDAIARLLAALGREAASDLPIVMAARGPQSGPDPAGLGVRPLAERRLDPPLADWTMAAFPLDPRALVASARLEARFYAWSFVLLAAGVAAGFWVAIGSAAREIRQARSRSDFVASISHDLRTPLASMRMLAESLQLGHVKDEAKRQAFLAAIIRESDRLARLTDRALYFVRLGQNAMAYRMQTGDLGALVRETVSAFKETVGMSGARISLALPEERPPARFDPDAMGQVLMNLLDNAVKYSPEQRDIRVVFSAEGRWVTVAVEDHGVGISRRDLRRIFRRFYRSPDVRVAGTSGAGLGLALCRQIVRAHGGRISVWSRPGKGSTFFVRLPAIGRARDAVDRLDSKGRERAS